MTALEWFAGEIKGGQLITNQKFKELLEQAKEMEKQQIKNVVISTFKAVDGYCFGMTAEEYYEEYFKTK